MLMILLYSIRLFENSEHEKNCAKNATLDNFHSMAKIKCLSKKEIEKICVRHLKSQRSHLSYVTNAGVIEIAIITLRFGPSVAE